MSERRKETGIVFDHSNAVNVSVRLNGKVIGAVKQFSGGWVYVPKQAASAVRLAGDLFPTVDDCCADVRGEEPCQHVNRR